MISGCLTGKKSVQCYPCGHVCFCVECDRVARVCGICLSRVESADLNASITRVMRRHFAYGIQKTGIVDSRNRPTSPVAAWYMQYMAGMMGRVYVFRLLFIGRATHDPSRLTRAALRANCDQLFRRALTLHISHVGLRTTIDRRPPIISQSKPAPAKRLRLAINPPPMNASSPDVSPPTPVRRVSLCPQPDIVHDAKGASHFPSLESDSTALNNERVFAHRASPIYRPHPYLDGQVVDVQPDVWVRCAFACDVGDLRLEAMVLTKMPETLRHAQRPPFCIQFIAAHPNGGNGVVRGFRATDFTPAK